MIDLRFGPVRLVPLLLLPEVLGRARPPAVGEAEIVPSPESGGILGGILVGPVGIGVTGRVFEVSPAGIHPGVPPGGSTRYQSGAPVSSLKTTRLYTSLAPLGNVPTSGQDLVGPERLTALREGGLIKINPADSVIPGAVSV